jgi:FtsP/CotA-like multicopper oxidase with cupredoxin domain
LPATNGAGGIRKFVDSLPGLGVAHANNLGNYIPIATPDTNTFPGSDYYRIGVSEYHQKLHSDLPPSKLRGYRDLGPGSTGTNNYLGPLIIAQRDRSVRLWFTNMLPANSSLFLPVDTTYMGAGMGPGMATNNMELYSENRAVLHLHGGLTPWISDGTPHQWLTPAGETTSYRKGASFQNVPDMVGPGTPVPSPSDNDGVGTYYYPNQQSGRLLWYHDHSYGLTRLNVYAGEVAGYLIHDTNEDQLISTGVLPNNGGGVYEWGIPLIIQDKTFVPSAPELAAEDPLWNTNKWGGLGNLWFPHVYMPNQNPNDITGCNPMGRWDYGPWFWPPAPVTADLPTISGVPESFMDTAVVNGQAYPYLNVEPKVYRFRILNGCNDRNLNLQLYFADPTNHTVSDVNGDHWGTEVPMVEAVYDPSYPAGWPTDGRDGGVPNPAAVGPNMIQIGTEGGFLPAPAIIPNAPINYVYDRRNIVVLDVNQRALFMGPAERADIVLDFSKVPSGSTVILYNDAPAPVPAYDTRYDYYTGDPDQTPNGGAPTTQPGYGPNTRTIMQFRVKGTPSQSYNLAALQTALPAVFAATQPPIIVPEPQYSAVYQTSFPATYSRIQDNYLTYTPLGSATPTTVHMEPKAIQELFDPVYGRMNALLGVELPFTSMLTQTTIPFYYIDPVTEVVTNNQVQIWKITHNGVDTHTIHFHLFNVQLLNRVGWDGAIRPPEPNELGWKEAVRMNPLEDCIIAIQPQAPTLPWGIPHSIRPMDVTMPLGSTTGFMDISATNNSPITVTNAIVDFGWEYVWHCHLLGHEENDMMRPISFNIPEVAPNSPYGLTATSSGTSQVALVWTNASIDVVGITIQRAVGTGAFSTLATVGPTRTNYTDLNVAGGVTYKFRVIA